MAYYFCSDQIDDKENSFKINLMKLQLRYKFISVYWAIIQFQNISAEDKK